MSIDLNLFIVCLHLGLDDFWVFVYAWPLIDATITFQFPNDIKWLPPRVVFGVGFIQPYLPFREKETVYDCPLAANICATSYRQKVYVIK